jgi:hypothetical protein
MWTLLYAIILSQSPGVLDAHTQAGVAALKAKNADEAITHFSSCIAEKPDNEICHWEIGWAHYLNGDWGQVVNHWEKVAKINPSRTDTAEHLATAHAQLALVAQLKKVRTQAPQTVRAAPPAGASLRLRAVGDVMLGTDFPKGYLPPKQGSEMLEGVLDWLQDADLTFANLEGPLCDRGRSSKCAPKSTNCYAFRTPASYGDFLVEAGIDLVSTANNHANDFGAICRQDTHTLLDGFGIAWSGPPGTVATTTANGLKIGMVAFHTSPSSNHLNNPETAKILIEGAAAQHDIVIVSFHGGAEGNKALHVPNGQEVFYGENRGHLRQFAHMAIDSGADIILGHGPHVPRGMEVYKERLIAYSLGNFATYGRFGLSGNLSVGLVLEAELDNQGRLVRGQILPTRQVGRGIPQKDTEKGQAIDLIRSLSQTDFGTTAPIIGQDGRFAPRASE